MQLVSKPKSLFVFSVCLFFFLMTDAAFATPSPRKVKGLFNQGRHAYQAGEIDRAISRWKEGLLLAQELGDRRLVAVFEANLGLALAAAGRYDQALDHYKRALDLQLGFHDIKAAVLTLNNMGAAYRATGRRQDALSAYKKALALARQSKDPTSRARTLGNLGIIYSASGNYLDALNSLSESVELYKDSGDKKNLAKALLNLGAVFTEMGQFDQAIESYNSALALFESENDSKGQALVLNDIGAVLLMQDKPVAAEDYFAKAMVIHTDLNDKRGLANDLINLGVAKKKQGDFQKALELADKALLILYETGDRLAEAAARGNIGLIYADTGRFADALKEMEKAYSLCRNFGLPEYDWRIYRGFAKAERGLGEYDKAENHYIQAINIIEDMRGALGGGEARTAFMQTKMHVYDELINLYEFLNRKFPRKGYDRKAFEIFEKKQARVFLEEMGRTGIRNFSGIPSGILEREQTLAAALKDAHDLLEAELAKPADRHDTKKILSLKERITGLERDIAAFETMLESRYPAYYTLKHPSPVDLDVLRSSVLSPDEAVMVFCVMEDKTLVWGISKDRFTMVAIPCGEERLTRLVHAYRDGYINIFKGEKLRGAPMPEPPAGLTPPEPEFFFHLLFPGPISEILKDYSTVYVVPTGPLYLLPFEALKDDSGRFLIQDRAFAYVSSASLLHLLRVYESDKQDRKLYPFLAFANPVYGKPKPVDDTAEALQVRSFYNIMRGEIAPLPETEQEVSSIKKILEAPDTSKPLRVRSEAACSVLFDLNEKGVLDDYRFISFACHGIIPDQVSGITQPALLLSTPDPNTNKVGLLSMSDVFSLKMNADLVALSACNTGRGEKVKGEGVIGLTRAFMYAGTPAVTVNLWSVETVSAQKLIIAFFDGLKKKMSRAESLRASKLQLLSGREGKMFSHPFFWAPTVIFGDGS